MINTTTDIQIINSAKLNAACSEILKLTIRPLIPKQVGPTTNKQYNKRQAIAKFCRLRIGRAFTEIDIQKVFQFIQVASPGDAIRKELYHDLTSHYPDFHEDMSGLVVPFKALLCLLWSEKILTLPFTIDLTATWTKNRDFEHFTHGFISTIAKGDSNAERIISSWQYRTSWHSPSDVNFSEIWSSIPKIVELNLEGGKKSFCFIPWLKRFSAKHKEIVSPDQCFYLERYQMHLISKRIRNEDISAHIKSYEEYVRYYVMTPEEADSLSKYDRILRRHKIRYINKRYGRSSPEAQLRQKERRAKEKLEAAIEEAKRLTAEKNHLYEKLCETVSAEDYFIHTSLPLRKPDFKWVTNSFYPGRPNVEIENTYAQWIRMGEIFASKLEHGRSSKSFIARQINHVRFLFDYIFFYLPLWNDQHPSSQIKLPHNIIDFERIAFWCDDLVDIATVSSYLPENGISADIEMPLTALKLRSLLYTDKTTKPFVNAVHLFFEVVKTYGGPVGIVDGRYANPINRHMDSTGSGGRSKSDKIQFPRDVCIIAKSYMSALDAIGVKIREAILTEKIDSQTAVDIKASAWIDLEKINLATVATVRSSTRPLETYNFPIKTIPNIYSWWHGTYHTSQVDRAATITTYLPWLSTLRMLAIGLYAGQRIQNGQWLDLRTFDKNYKDTYVDDFNLCILHVNTDKNGHSKDTVIDGDVMKSLIDEKYFQTQICTSHPGLVYYENDPRDPNEYGLICPLFRSPWKGNDLPFADSTYSNDWLHFCRGLEQVYNSIVAPDCQHSFTRKSKSGIERAVHVPHSLRVTWISHMRLYGHLHIAYAAQQVAHSVSNNIAVETEYYTVPSREDMLENINRANKIVSDSAYEALMGKIPKPSSPDSAICRGWQENKEALIKDQNLRSQHFFLIDSQESGIDLIAKTESLPGFYTHCICMRDGDCPKKLIEFTGRSRVCSLCEIAVWGIDHLPGINVKMRQAQTTSIQLIDKIKKLSDANISQAEIDPYHQELTIARYELASYKHISDQLNTVLDKDSKNPKYISRYRDLSGVKRHAVDMANPLHRVIAEILDSEAYPHLMSENYLHSVDRLAKSPVILALDTSDRPPKQLLACQLSTILRSGDFTMDEVFSLAFEANETTNRLTNAY